MPWPCSPPPEGVTSHTAALPRAHGAPVGAGIVKVQPDDFRVEEHLSFEPTGDGEHVFLRIEKQAENTEYVARRLARLAGVASRDVGFAGLKDRHGRTTQWFSVHLPGREGPDWRALEDEHLRVLAVTRNPRKLRHGAIAGNRFEITVQLEAVDRPALDHRLKTLAESGYPNYFGDQRFGHGGGNLAAASNLFRGEGPRPGPHRRGLYLSAARAELFNRILALRVRGGTWNRPVPGDVFMFQGSNSCFAAGEITADVEARVSAGSLHPSGCLWGSGPRLVSGEAARLEAEALAGAEDLCRGLERFGLALAHRPLRVVPKDLSFAFGADARLRLCFELPPGAYATMLLREPLLLRGAVPGDD